MGDVMNKRQDEQNSCLEDLRVFTDEMLVVVKLKRNENESIISKYSN